MLSKDDDELDENVEEYSASESPLSIVSSVEAPRFWRAESLWSRPKSSKIFLRLPDDRSLALILKSSSEDSFSCFGGKKQTKRPSSAQSAPQALGRGTLY